MALQAQVEENLLVMAGDARINLLSFYHTKKGSTTGTMNLTFFAYRFSIEFNSRKMSRFYLLYPEIEKQGYPDC